MSPIQVVVLALAPRAPRELLEGVLAIEAAYRELGRTTEARRGQ